MKRFITAIIMIVFIVSGNISFAKEPNLTFKNVYHKAFYRNPWITGSILAVTTVAAVSFTTFTAGTGAPASAAGVSTVASWVAGGGAGSYMAGLSIVGSTFGGNAILGAAILNSTSAMVLGGTGLKTLPVISKLVMTSLEMGQIAIVFTGKDAEEYGYSIVITLSDRIGGENANEMVNQIKNINKDFEKEKISYSNYNQARINLRGDAIRLFRSYDEEDKAVSLVVLHNLGYIDDFIKYGKKIPEIYKEEYNFLLYLKSIALLIDGQFAESAYITKRIMNYEPKVIEPILINALANHATNPKEFGIQSNSYLDMIDKYGKYYYNSPNNKLNAYVLLGSLSSQEKKEGFGQLSGEDHWKSNNNAIEYFSLALKELDFIGDKDKKANIYALLGNAYYNIRNYSEARASYMKSVKYADTTDIESTFYWSDYK
jgi:hypothetical protein